MFKLWARYEKWLGKWRRRNTILQLVAIVIFGILALIFNSIAFLFPVLVYILLIGIPTSTLYKGGGPS